MLTEQQVPRASFVALPDTRWQDKRWLLNLCEYCLSEYISGVIIHYPKIHRIIWHPSGVLTILHLIPDGILCESCLGMICIRKHAHPSHRYSSPPHCHFSWICTQAKDSQPSVVIIVDFQTQKYEIDTRTEWQSANELGSIFKCNTCSRLRSLYHLLFSKITISCYLFINLKINIDCKNTDRKHCW